MPKTKLYLRPEAIRDMERVWSDGLTRWSVRQCEACLDGLYEHMLSLTEFPERYRERDEFTPPVRIAPYQSHIVIYRQEAGTLDVLRIRHGSEDWMEVD